MSLRRGQLSDVLADMSAAIGEVSRSTGGFEVLHEMVPFVAEIRRAETCNKNILELIKNVPQVLPNLRDGGLNRNGQAFSTMFSRMVANLQGEFDKVNEEVENVEKGIQSLQVVRQEQLQAEIIQFVRDIELNLAENAAKIMSLIRKEEQQHIQKTQENTHCISRISTHLATSSIAIELQECKELMGQIRCLSVHRQHKEIKSKSEIKQKSKFIGDCESYFQREVNFVVENIEKLRSVKANKDSVYQQRLLVHFVSWCRKLIVSLESALLKITSFQKQSDEYDHSELQAKSTQACSKWYSMLHRLSSLLQ